MAATAPSEARGSSFGMLLTLVLVVLLGAQLAYWTWVFLAPPAAPAPEPANDTGVDLAAISRMFGAAPPAGTAAAPSSTLRLKGVVAPTPGTAASAIFSTGSGRDVAVYVGGEVQPGVKLARVHPDHVVLIRDGVEERVDLEALRASVPAARGAANPRAGFRLNVARSGNNAFSFSRNELDQALRDPHQLNYLGALGTPAGGGVRMEQAPPGSLAQKLGLQAGDVIKRINGQAIASQGDLARVYTQFNTLSSIQAEVQRGGTTVNLTYAIQP